MINPSNLFTFQFQAVEHQSQTPQEFFLSLTHSQFDPDNNIKKFTKEILSAFATSARVGAAHREIGISFERFLYGILLSLGYLVFQTLLFLLLRIIFKRLYQGKRVLNPEGFKSNWLKTIITADIESYKESCGLDAYLMLRFLKFLAFFSFTTSIVNLPVLLPIHYISGSDSTSLDRLNMSNIDSKVMVIHLIMCIFLVSWFFALLHSELKITTSCIKKEINKGRYQHILFLDNVILNKRELIEKFQIMGNIEGVCYIPKDYKKIYLIWKKMRHLEHQLEKITLEVYLEQFFSERMKDISGSNKFNNIFKSTNRKLKFNFNKYVFQMKTLVDRSKWRFFRIHGANKGSIYRLPLSFRFKKRSFLKDRMELLPKKIEEYHKVVKELIKRREYLEKKNNPNFVSSRYFYNKAFIEFDSAITCHLFAQLLNNNQNDVKLVVGPDPQDIIWSNVSAESTILKWIRGGIARIFGVLIIVGWIIPVGLIGLLSQIPYLAYLILIPNSSEFRSEVVYNLVIIIFPVVSLIFLTECAPYIFRLLSYLKGCRTGSEIEVDTQKWFFAFLFVHLFLVVTISSGVSFVIENLINNPTTVPSILAAELPKSSNFFCSFILMRGMAYCGGNLIRIGELFIEVFYYKLCLYTPHKRLERLRKSLYFQWGSVYPIFSVLGCITVIYSVIAPLILPLACVSFILVYYSFKYLFEYQYSYSNSSETFGKLYPQALMQLYAGIYFLEVCLLGLFVVSNQYIVSIAMILLFVVTIITHAKFASLFLCGFQQVDYTCQKSGFDSSKLPSFQLNCNVISKYQLPMVTFDRNIKKLWIPCDSKGLVHSFQMQMQNQFGLILDIDRCFIDDEGDIYLHI
ncbi:Spo75p KNAG_0H02510 [Huiozyma naganishii CBS 8797]|uniref:CSC1/OSCA1-like 7TM region domain-containing protein n=1 Tax=Huiozyma naganishii (strain ATCC MYA-139 / BCRC 22969 / CBS 8797 / KCTC 17520 / NBRC 10181 / NCYC 3082 / Yp74L-3) TaxID=1071383 RepID=J7S9R8_HUIN7|nr:hypothetical protein KNAG_0H02510 [Kazachstania naganishii CBS 8797]CCK71666.1 hypothetical protein KNAG_0H02510 [Kazachstania naganishii CBS 8797]